MSQTDVHIMAKRRLQREFNSRGCGARCLGRSRKQEEIEKEGERERERMRGETSFAGDFLMARCDDGQTAVE